MAKCDNLPCHLLCRSSFCCWYFKHCEFLSYVSFFKHSLERSVKVANDLGRRNLFLSTVTKKGSRYVSITAKVRKRPIFYFPRTKQISLKYWIMLKDLMKLFWRQLEKRFHAERVRLGKSGTILNFQQKGRWLSFYSPRLMSLKPKCFFGRVLTIQVCMSSEWGLWSPSESVKIQK